MMEFLGLPDFLSSLKVQIAVQTDPVLKKKAISVIHQLSLMLGKSMLPEDQLSSVEMPLDRVAPIVPNQKITEKMDLMYEDILDLKR